MSLTVINIIGLWGTTRDCESPARGKKKYTLKRVPGVQINKNLKMLLYTNYLSLFTKQVNH